MTGREKTKTKLGRPKKRGRPINWNKRWYRAKQKELRKLKPKKRKTRSDKGKTRLSHLRNIEKRVKEKPVKVKREKVVQVPKRIEEGRSLTFVDYDIAQMIVRRAGIRSFAHYKKWRREERVLAVPGSPDVFYSNQWTTWGDFLGVHNQVFGRKKKYRPYWEAVRFAQKFCADNGITSSTMWKEKWDARGMPDDIPKYPNQIYPDDWQSWDVWLGKSVLSKLNAMKEVVGVVAICSVPEQPSSYISAIVAEDGFEQLKEKVREQGGRPLKLYVWQQATRQKFNDTLSRFTSPQGDGTLFCPNINQLIFELDNTMDWFRPTVG